MWQDKEGEESKSTTFAARIGEKRVKMHAECAVRMTVVGVYTVKIYDGQIYLSITSL